MQQMEDLSAIIRTRDADIEDLNVQIEDLHNDNRNLHQTISDIKNEQAALNANKGLDMLSKSSMAEKMMMDPRFQNLMNKQ